MKPKHLLKWDRSTSAQTLAISAKNLVMTSLGLSYGIPTILIPGLLAENSKGIIPVSHQEITWIGSIFLATVPIGSLLSGLISNYLGRKRCIQLVNIPFATCWIILYRSSQIWHVYLSLGVMGLFGGLVEAPFAAYISEVTEPTVRGKLSPLTSTAVTIGFLIEFLLGAFFHWRTVAGLCAILPVLSFIALTLVPESPHWLVMEGKLEDALRSLAWLRGWTAIENVKCEFDNIYEILKVDGERSKVSLKQKISYLLKKNFIWPLFLALFVYSLSNFCGGITFQTYSVNIFATLKVPLSKYYATLLLGVVQFVSSCLLPLFIHKLGKRSIVFVSLSGVGLCSVVVSIYTFVFDVKHIINDEEKSNLLSDYRSGYEWIPLICFMVLCFMFYFGLSIMPWLLISEIFPYETRSTGCGICAALAYVFGFISNKTFLYMVDGLLFYGTYAVHAGVCFLGILVLYFTLPETEGKPLEEIANHFSGVSRLSNKIHCKTSSNDNTARDNPTFCS